MPENLKLNRTEGMVWIDQDAPYRMKYHTHGEDYVLETAVTYTQKVTGTEDEIVYGYPVGTVVKLDSNGQLAKAQFPMDLANVLGVILQTAVGQIPSGQSSIDLPITVGKSGSIIVPLDSADSAIVGRDLQAFGSALDLLKGAPVYWDCGYIESTGNYAAPIAGAITAQTPSGFKYRQNTTPSNQEWNIGYNNLPQIGNISNVSQTEIEINLNFSAFDSTIEWFWPAIGAASGSLSATSLGSPESSITLRHGLFAPTTIERVQTTVKCPCSATAVITENNTEEQIDLLGYFSHTPGVNGTDSSYTTLTYSSPVAFDHVYISGEVIYGFNKH